MLKKASRPLPGRRIAQSILALMLCVTPWTAAAAPFEPIPLYTEAWPPYVERNSEHGGAVTRIVEMVLRDMRLEPQRRYLDFYLAYELVREAEVRLAFPYFRTSRRIEEDPEVLFSDEILSVDNALYFSRVHNAFENENVNPSEYRIGKVIGYSYGEAIESYLDEATEFRSEVLALRALFEGEIDLLPMTTRVGEALVLQHYPLNYPDFRALDNIRSEDPIHLITVNDEEGRRFMARFNASLKRLARNNRIDEALEIFLEPPQSNGYVRLVAAEGYPVVIGQTHSNSDLSQNRFVMIPQGSRALVLDWSEAVYQEFLSENLFSTMTLLTLVKIVDGPHAGRELFVKNLHIEIE